MYLLLILKNINLIYNNLSIYNRHYKFVTKLVTNFFNGSLRKFVNDLLTNYINNPNIRVHSVWDSRHKRQKPSRIASPRLLRLYLYPRLKPGVSTQ